MFREDIDMADGENDNDEEGEVPMLHLASFALHKLFSEWQSEGFEIPDFKIGAPAPGAVQTPMETAAAIDKALNAPGVPPKRTTLPENANTMHPTTLLCMVNFDTQYYLDFLCLLILIDRFSNLVISRCVHPQNTWTWVAKVKHQTLPIVLALKSTKSISLDRLRIRNRPVKMPPSMHAINALARNSSKRKTKFVSICLHFGSMERHTR